MTVLSWLLVLFGFCLLIILHEAGHFFAAKATGMRVERFFLFFGPTIWSVKRGETEYGIKSIPLGGYVKINGMNPEEEMPPGEEDRAYCKQKVWKRIAVVAAGPAVNIALAFLIFFAVFNFGGLESLDQSVGSIRSGTPASKVLQEGDRIVAVDGHRYPGVGIERRLTKFGHLVSADECPGAQVKGCRGAVPLTVTVRRDGQLKTISVRPEYDPELKRVLIGFSYGGHWVPISTGHAANRAAESVWTIADKTASIFSHIFEAKQRDQISGVVGISDVGHTVVQEGWREALLLLGMVSLSLGLINLLPILPLDGGHIFWSLIEKARGEPVSLQVVERATLVGFVLVAALIFIGLGNDIGRITGEGFKTR